MKNEGFNLISTTLQESIESALFKIKLSAEVKSLKTYSESPWRKETIVGYIHIRTQPYMKNSTIYKEKQ